MLRQINRPHLRSNLDLLQSAGRTGMVHYGRCADGTSVSPRPNDRARPSRSRRFLRLALGFWSGTTRAQAWLLTVAILFFLLANLGAALAVNRWNKFFFDALEQKDTRTVILGLGYILILAALSAAFSVGLLQARMRLQVRWRQWLARTLIARWLADRHFYQLAVVPTEADNPEARIAEDGRTAIELLVDMSLGVLNAVLAAVSFVGILWVVGGALTVAGYSIPGYMVFACIIYSAITTTSMFLLSRPLVRRVEQKAAGEAQLRYELTRVRDNAENIALIGGDEDERRHLDATLSDLVQRWLGVIVWQGRMMWLNGANLVLAPVVPLLLGAPKYLSGDMTLGSLMQAATAFVQVQLALNWLADNALRLADWFASSHRVTQLSDALDRLEASLGPIDRAATITLGASPDNRVHLRRLNIALHDGKLRIDGDGGRRRARRKSPGEGRTGQRKKHAHSRDGRIVALGQRRNPAARRRRHRLHAATAVLSARHLARRAALPPWRAEGVRRENSRHPDALRPRASHPAHRRDRPVELAAVRRRAAAARLCARAAPSARHPHHG